MYLKKMNYIHLFLFIFHGIIKQLNVLNVQQKLFVLKQLRPTYVGII